MSDKEAGPVREHRPDQDAKRAAIYERADIREGTKVRLDIPKAEGEDGEEAFAPEFTEAMDRFQDEHPDVDEEVFAEITGKNILGRFPGLTEAFNRGDYDYFLKRAYECAMLERERSKDRAYTVSMSNQRYRARGLNVDGFDAFLKEQTAAQKKHAKGGAK